MDRRDELDSNVVGNVIEGITGGLKRRLDASDAGYDKPKGIIVGFIPVCEFVENGEIIANLAYLLARRDLAVCVADFKVFYPNLFDWLGGVEAPKKSEGLIRLLNSDRTEINSVAVKADNDNVFLISPSPNDDIEDYYNFSMDDVKRVMTVLKESFDVVLVDIPNNPPLEFFVGAIKNCQRGFFVAAERVDASRNIQKIIDYMLKVGDEIRNFGSIIMARVQDLPFYSSDLTGIALKDSDGDETKLKIVAKVPLVDPATVREMFSENGFKNGDGSTDKVRLTARLPFVKAAQEFAIDGKIYMRDNSFLNKIYKEFNDEITKIANTISEVNS